MCSSRRSTSPAERSCRAPASRWRCRCSKRWCRRGRRWRRPRRRRQEPLRRHLLPARHGARPLGAEGRRRAAREAALHPRVAGERARTRRSCMSGLWSQSAEPPEGTTGSDHWVAAAFLTGIKPRKTAGSDATVGSADDRPDDRAEDRPGHAAAVAAAGRRGSELELEQLRRRLQLLVHELDLVGRAADAGRRTDAADQPAADGAQSAGGLRAAVRQRRHAGGARRSG